jgi:hypothetical protein
LFEIFLLVNQRIRKKNYFIAIAPFQARLDYILSTIK